MKKQRKNQKKGNQRGLTMERKIGEIFEYQGEWYQCVKNDMYDYCKGCASFENLRCTTLYGNSDCWLKATCKKLEKVGEPYRRWLSPFNNIMVQRYRLYGRNVIMPDEPFMYFNAIDNTIAIEIKQTKEDMEETNFIEKLETLCKRYNMPDGIRTDFISEVKEIIKDKEECNFKPFNLKAAKAGKPVCTRDGRKARIICFDVKDTQPIIGLYEKNIDGIVREYLCSYHTDGRMYDDQNTGYDLMMSPEKKEGWVNVYKGIDGITFSRHPHISKEKAIEEAGSLPGRIDTVKVFWEE